LPNLRTRLLSLDALSVLDAIDRKGSFAAAAEELHRVPSAITCRVQKPEQALDILLFDRRGHRAKLTPAGRELLVEGRRLLRAAGELEHRIKGIATGWEPELRVAVDTIIPFQALYPLLDRFYRDCTRDAPRTRLRLSSEAVGGTWDALLDARADLVIGAPEAPSGARIRVRRLGEIEMVFAVAPRHALAKAGEPIGIETLREHCIVGVSDSSRVSPPRTIGLFDGQDTLTVPDIQAKLTAQAADLGGAWLPRFLAAPAAAGQLVIKRVAEPRPAVPVHVTWRAERPGRVVAEGARRRTLDCSPFALRARVSERAPHRFRACRPVSRASTRVAAPARRLRLPRACVRRRAVPGTGSRCGARRRAAPVSTGTRAYRR
jgi:DNA-binding transcriptional LysR family regulator